MNTTPFIAGHIVGRAKPSSKVVIATGDIITALNRALGSDN